ncbi:MAG: Ig-like domain-containing protein [Clostridia bacterium]|nr:Ig-like domain-containing protein [Clostridia bacterium]
MTRTKFIAALTAFLMRLSFMPGRLFTAIPSEAADSVPTLRVDMSAEDHEILHGSAGFLYGISNEGVPDVNTLTPLKPKVLATKGALGTEHPYGDALDVADEFFEAGGEQVQMYCSNYYGVFGVTADAYDYADVLQNTIAPAVAEWKDTMREKYPDIDQRIVYIPINEGTPRNYNGGESTIMNSWKVYYDAIKAVDENAVIAGPNNATYGDSYANMRSFLTFCRDNDCLPDIVTWHELQVSCLNTMSSHIADYRKICSDLGIEEKQIVINEYADFSDCGVPGRLVNWIAHLEDNQVYGCLPFWHQANNLNDLAANANQGNGAWWVYKWYGDMSGQTLDVQTENTTYDALYGLATIDENKRKASVLLGGCDDSADIILENVTDTSVFSESDRVHVKVEATYFTGYHGASYEPETILDGTFPIAEDGSVTITLDDMLFSTAYNITITESSSEIAEPSVASFRAEYEAEDAAHYGDLTIDLQNSPLETPRYFCSGGKRVGGIDSEGEGILYSIDVPTDGLYSLSFIYGNGTGSTRNNAETHCPLNITQKLVVDGEESVIELPNTLFYSMEGSVEKYVNLTKGHHTVALMYNGDDGGFHDMLVVSYAGSYGEERPAFDKRYEAEDADFNTLGSTTETTVRTESSLSDSSGNGYVIGLNSSPVENGGGIRWIVDVEDSGLYHLNFGYLSESGGQIRVYLDNTNLTFDNLAAALDISSCNTWSEGHVTIYLRQGINVIDIDCDCDAAIDYMDVIYANIDYSQTIEAEDASGSFETAVSGENTYVKEMLNTEQYLEFTVTVPEDGAYKMQVFQSNNDLCGTHSYNIKIIDRDAVFVINGDEENARRYFFPNTFSDDTFLERTITLSLNEGENTIRVYNDDSCYVLWGGSTSEPGTNVLVNYTPNFDKFIITPASVDAEITDREYKIDISSTKNGYVYCSKNTAQDGETVTLSLLPDGGIEKLSVNGEDYTSLLSTQDGNLYTVEITIEGDTTIYAEFSEATEGDFTDTETSSDEYVSYNGSIYKLIGENLFSNGDFTDTSGDNMDEWYVGVNSDGHPSSSSYQIPKINSDGTLQNLVPLTESGLLTTGGYEIDNNNTFYYGNDGTRKYLVEHIDDDWTNCAWNGSQSLLAYIPVKSNTKYYFKFQAYSVSGKASIRYGAINMDSYVPEKYSRNEGLSFCGSGYVNCNNGEVQNVGGSWTTYTAVIDTGDNGDYFFFNAYWLQMAQYLCLGDFELYELADEEAAEITSIESPAALTVLVGESLNLPETAIVTTSDGEEYSLPVTWLNADAVDTSLEGIYIVTGRVVLPDNLYYSGTPYVKQRVIVLYAAEISDLSTDGGKISFNLIGSASLDAKIYIAVYSADSILTQLIYKDVSINENETIAVSEPLTLSDGETVKVLLWKSSITPLTPINSL